MPQSLLIVVRFSEGRYHGQDDGFNGADGWPPSPGRLFQALVAAAARGANLLPEDVRALEWMEGLKPPRIAAPAARRGRPVKLFVPNNDLDSVGGDPARVSEIRVGKQWRPCFFDSDEPVLYLWDFEPRLARAERICAIAERMYQLGRGIDMRGPAAGFWTRTRQRPFLSPIRESFDSPLAQVGRRHRVRGRSTSLLDRHRLKRRRLTTVGTGRKSRQLFRQPPKASFGRTGYDAPPHRLHFELRRSEGGFAPRPPCIRRASDCQPARCCGGSAPGVPARKCRTVREACHRPWRRPRRSCPAHPIDSHSVDRCAAHGPLHPARRGRDSPDCPIRDDDVRWAFAGRRPCDPRTGEAWPGSLVSTDDTQMGDRFGRPARVFRSMTPVALPGASRRRIDGWGRKGSR